MFMILSFRGFCGCTHHISKVGQKECEIQFLNGNEAIIFVVDFFFFNRVGTKS